jgi:hypothetical protein
MTTPVTDGSPLVLARRRDVERRQQRVSQALATMLTDGREITISAVAARARVHRSFIHRHSDLRAAVCAAADDPIPAGAGPSRATFRRALPADNVNLHESNRGLSQRIADLDSRQWELLGQQTFPPHRAGRAAPDHAALEARIQQLQQQALDHRRTLEERDEELAAAREAHRRLMTETNRPNSSDGRS